MEMILRRAGPMTTVQDLGRPGHRAAGVPACGAFDEVALRVANLLVGNDESAAGIEAALTGPVVAFDQDAVVAVCGATVENVPAWRPIALRRRQPLDLRRIVAGCRVYLAVTGGIDLPPVLGSRSTDVRNGIGGLDGRRLRDGDRLPIGARSAPTRGPAGCWRAADSVLPPYSPSPALRVLRGPRATLLPPASFRGQIDHLVERDSDRVGVRLRSDRHGTVGVPDQLASRPVTPGAVQLPPDGRAIILGPDAGTIGGYAVVAHVIAADLPLVAQLRPGDRVTFIETTLGRAHAALVDRQRRLAILRAGLRTGHTR